jgi:hypothetical protein
MKKIYLLIYSSALGTRDQVKALLDEMPEVISWRYEIPYSFFIISERTKKEIGLVLHERAHDPKQARILVVDITNDTSIYGWISRDTWNYISAVRDEVKAAKSSAS